MCCIRKGWARTSEENNKITKENANKIWSVFTILIMTKTKDFRSLVEVCLHILDRSFGLQPNFSSVFSKNLCCLWEAFL